MTSNRLRRPVGTTALAVALSLACLGGCVRLDTPAPDHPSMDAAQVRRQDAALDAATIADTARRVVATTPNLDPVLAGLLETIAQRAEEQAAGLGGVWVAWPDGPPEGVATPEPTPTSVTGPADAATVLALLHADWADERERALDPEVPAGQRALHVSLAVARAGEAAALAGALGVEAPDATDPAPPPPGGNAVASSDLGTPLFPGTEDADAVAILDSAVFGLETAAARSEGGVRDVAVGRAAQARGWIDALLAAGAPDARRAAWASGDASAFPDAGAMARASLMPVLSLHVRAATEAEDSTSAAIHLDEAARTAVALVQVGAPLSPADPGAEPAADELGALPGIIADQDPEAPR